MKDHFKVGTIVKTRGLKGELQLYVDFDNLEDINFNAVFIDIAGKLKVPYFVESVKYQKNTAWLYLEDVESVELASKLAKKDVYLSNKLKPKKKKDEFYAEGSQRLYCHRRARGRTGRNTRNTGTAPAIHSHGKIQGSRSAVST